MSGRRLHQSGRGAGDGGLPRERSGGADRDWDAASGSALGPLLRGIGAVLAATGALVFALAPLAAKADDSHDSGISVNVPGTAAPNSRNPSTSAPFLPQDPSPSDGNVLGINDLNGGGANNGGSGNSPGATPSGDGRGNGGPCAQTEPELPPQPADDAWAAIVDKDLYLPGNKVTTTAEGFKPGEWVQLALFSEPQLIGNFTADQDGLIQAVFAVADDAPPGTHSIQFTGWCGDVVAQADVLVGSPGEAPPDDGWPAWLWWLLAIVLALVLIGVAWRVIRAARSGGAEQGAAGL